MLGKPGTLRRMKEINIPKAKKLVRKARRAPFTRRSGNTDLQVTVVEAENCIYSCIAFLLMLIVVGISSSSSFLSIAAQLGLIALLAHKFITKICLSRIRDYLIANKIQNLDELER